MSKLHHFGDTIPAIHDAPVDEVGAEPITLQG
jgi:hypothetical protein